MEQEDWSTKLNPMMTARTESEGEIITRQIVNFFLSLRPLSVKEIHELSDSQ